jgi:DNA polymerase elongation subunit (family B)
MGSQLINTFYVYQNRREGMEFDKIMMITKDKDGNKSCNIVEKPVIEYYITKPQHWYEYDENNQILTDNNGQPIKRLRNYIEKEKVVPVRCYYKDIYKSIVNTLNDQTLKNYFSESLQAGTNIGQRLRRIHLDYRLHGSDVNIQDYYIGKYLQKNPYAENNYELTKVVYDIEVDIEHIQGFPNPEEAEAPINIATLVDMNNLKCYTLCLEYDFDSYKRAMERIDEIKATIHEKYKEILKGKEMEFIIEEYSDEVDLIKRFFHLINVEIKPDFVLAWNGHGFDNPYIMNRVIRLGFTPEEIMCPKEFRYKRVSYRKDFRNQDPADNSSEFSITSYSIYLDAMNLYANLRKGMGKEESYSLDYIGEKEVGLRKDEMEEGFKTFHRNNYEKFMLYNIQDTIMMAMMEWKNNDVDAIYNVAMLTQTRVEKAMKKTICLRNLASKFYDEQGAYISNNRAQLREHPEGKIKGAFVADPNLVDNIGMKVLNMLSQFMFENCIDFDLSSLYPSIILALNISPETCYGKIDIRDAEGNDIGGEFVEDFASRDYVNFVQKWFNVAKLEEMIAELSEKPTTGLAS